MSKPLEPWEQCSDVWKTKAAFFNWMRGQMRRAWVRHPVKVSYMNLHRFKAPLGKKTFKAPKGQMIWATTCETCHKVHKVGNTEVDHVHRAGSFQGWDDFEKWMHSLMHINHDSIEIICKPCHRIKSYAEQHDLSFEDAKLAKKVIAFMKQKASAQLRCLHSYGFDMSKLTNAAKRKAAYTEYLRGINK